MTQVTSVCKSVIFASFWLVCKCVTCQMKLKLYVRVAYVCNTMQVSLSHDILLHPRYFGPNLLNTVKQKLFT